MENRNHFNLKKSFNKLRYIDRMGVFISDIDADEDFYELTLYYGGYELLSIVFDKFVKGGKKYMVCVNRPFYENGTNGFVKREKETEKQYVFLETDSPKIAFNMVSRIVNNGKYPRPKLAW